MELVPSLPQFIAEEEQEIVPYDRRTAPQSHILLAVKLKQYR